MGTYIELIHGDDNIVLRPVNPSAIDPIRCKSYDFGYAEPREDVTPNPGSSGDDDQTSLHGSRQVSIEMAIDGDDSITKHAYADLLRKICQPRNRPVLHVDMDGWDVARRMYLSRASLVNTIGIGNAETMDASLAAYVPSGLWEAAAEWSADIPKGTPTTVEHAGTAPSPATLVIYGPIADPVITITNDDGTKTMTFDGLTVASDEYVEIDTDAKTILLDGDSAQSLYTYVDWATSEWFDIIPGDNDITITGTGTPSDDALLTWLDRWF